NNAGGNISIDRSANSGIFNQGTFTNTATLTIGKTEIPGESGIYNFATFTNNTGGQISIDRTTISAISNSSGTFTNAAKLTIGGIASVGNWGMFNNGTFNNETGGDISIDNSARSGISNQGTAIFTNSAKLAIGKTISVGGEGIYNRATFNNNVGGNISINRSTDYGFAQVDGIFTNGAKLIIGDVASAGFYGFYTVSPSVFNNLSCGEVLIKQGRLEHGGPYNNYGYTLVEDRLSSYDTFTNEGILKYNSRGGTAIVNTTASSIIVKNSPIPIFDYGDVNDNYNGVISIFSDSASTISAGTFIAPNTFVPDPILPIGSQTLYAKITPSGGLCSHIVPFTYNNKSNANLIALTSSAGTLNPVFNSAEFRYTISVDDLTTSITLTPTTLASAATVTVNGNAVSSGVASTAINLNSGFNTIAIVVTAEDGTTTMTYTVVVTRSDNLISITPTLAYICSGESVQFTASGCTGTVSWEGSGGQQTTGISTTFTPVTTTSYFVSCNTGGNTAFSIQVAAISVAINSDILNESLAVKALQQIISNRKIGLAGISPTANISFEAGNFIELLPGFEAVNSSVFRAEIKQCPNL
ncbi:MAG: cadherin-like beta sandwich domain-containing protein, partial [Spirosomaceae bacterium]|nr:cadherin-like beta sandwich domain-containing protein [Spirosomataceae bacterium]